MNLKPFRIEHYFAKYEFTAEYTLSSSDAQSRNLADLFALEPTAKTAMDKLWLGYTESPGAPTLRQTISGIYENITAEDVLVTAAAEEGIFLAYHALVGDGDHVIVETPCYESALELARSTGAQVSPWDRHFEDAWQHDLDALETLLQPNTRFMYINTPSNPTGTLMAPDTFRDVLAWAESHNITVFCDEVYRESEHDPTDRLPAACDLYTNAISLGSMSKSYGLPGLRLGWLVCRNPDILQKLHDMKLYTSICSSAPSEFLCDLALRHRQALVDDTRSIIHTNLALLEDFITRYTNMLSWVKPQASTICFPKVQLQGKLAEKFAGNVTAWCEDVVNTTSVMLLPGTVYDMTDHVRIGYGRRNMPEALGRLEQYLQDYC
ncbi:MAG: aminotransferase class I/II-fold pyridoxal phosphate-dependent enzyme [Deinococcota bacterium]